MYTHARNPHIHIRAQKMRPLKPPQTKAPLIHLQTHTRTHSTQVEIVGHEDVTFPYIPSHLHWIPFELLKNALAATLHHPPASHLHSTTHPHHIKRKQLHKTTPASSPSAHAHHSSMRTQHTRTHSTQVEIVGHEDVTFPYIPSHLHYIVFELLKNAMAATLHRHQHDAVLPPIQVVLGGKVGVKKTPKP